MEETSRLERKTIIKCRKQDTNQSYHTSHTNLYNELLPIANKTMLVILVVGSKERRV